MMKKMKSIFLMFILTVFMTLSVYTNVSARDESDKVRVGCFGLHNYFNINDNNVSGYGAEYFEELADLNHWDYEYVTYNSWDSALQGLRNNEIDILSPAQHTEDRDNEYLFSSFSVGTEYGALLANNESPLIYEDYDAFMGINVGVVPQLVFLDDFKEYEKIHNFNVNFVYYENTTLLMDALKESKIEAALCNLMVKEDDTKLLARFGVAPYYYIMNSENKEMKVSLDNAIDKLKSQNPGIEEELKKKYFPDMSETPLSKQELDYIASRGAIKVACDKDSKPFSYENSYGEIVGLDNSFLSKISSLTGLTFDLYSTPFTDEDLFYKENQIDLIAGVEYSLELSKKRYTDSYFTVNKCFIGKKNESYKLDDSLKVAVISSSQNQISQWKKQFPNYQFINYNTLKEGFEACNKGKVDIILENRYTVLSYLDSPRYAKYGILPMQTISEAVCYELIEEVDGSIDSTLLSIMNKTISKITQDEKDAILADAVKEYSYKMSAIDFIYQYRTVLICISISLIIFIIGTTVFIIKISHSKNKLAENEMKLSRITNNINGGVVVLKPNEGLDIIYANDGFLELIGLTREEFEQKEKKYLAYVIPTDLVKIQEAILSNQTEISLKLHIMKNDGTFLPTLFNGTFGVKVNGERELYCVILDMSIQENLFNQLQVENARTKLILDRVEEIFYEINLMDNTITTSNSFKKRLGWNLPDRIDSFDEENFEKMWNLSNEDKKKLYKNAMSLINEKEVVTTIVKVYSENDNKYIYSEILQYPILDDSSHVRSIIGLIRNIDKEVSEREKLIMQVKLDSLTGLLNKGAFMEEVTQYLKENQNQNSCLLFIDLDHFKEINDTLGHLIGDMAIKDASNKLKGMFSNNNYISRFGGDEFCIFIKAMNINSLKEKMKFVIEQLREDYTENNKHIHVTCSCGIASTKESGYDYNMLMKNADMALYEAKDKGRDRYIVFEEIQNK